MTRTEHRSIREWVVVKGTLVLESPAHLGGGDLDALTDMPVLLNEVDDRPLLTGTSIAGALRNYLRERQQGDSVKFGKTENGLYATLLFGGHRGDDDGIQSPLVVHDAVGTLSGYELRDGVAIDPATRTAEDKKKFDIQLLGAGTTFPLQFDLAIGKRTEDEDMNAYRVDLIKALATALKGLEDGEITLGARKRRGFGRCTVRDWEVACYDLSQREGLLAWLASDRDPDWQKMASVPVKKGAILPALGVSELLKDNRQRVQLKARFALDGTLLIRSGFGEADTRADTVHLHAIRSDGSSVPVIPGTSWAGVLRHRALKIARTLSDDREVEVGEGENKKTVKLAVDFVDGLFGPSEIDKNADSKSSRVVIDESEVRDASSLEITRVKIDRFTGGAYESALFTEQPLVGTPDSVVELVLTVRGQGDSNKYTPDEETGLLLLLLKDLWTGDLPIGGESSVGRGRLQGLEATLSAPAGKWTLRTQPDGKLSVENPEQLQKYVDDFNARMVKHD